MSSSSISDPFASWSDVESTLVYSVAAGFVGYVIFFPLYRSRKSFWDAIAARRVMGGLRVLLFINTLSCLVLLYLVAALGRPIPVPYKSYALAYGSNNSGSWIFDYPRPVWGLVIIGIGVFGDMHPAPRILCMLGCLLQMLCDGISYVFVNDYIVQHDTYAAPFEGIYTSGAMIVYKYRDIVSMALNVWILLLCAHLTCLVGWCEPQLITYQMIVGGQLDRCEIMRMQVDKRSKLSEEKKFAQSPVPVAVVEHKRPETDQDWAQNLVRSNINGNNV